MVAVRLDWTLEEFYSDGGVTKFTDRMAAVLGIHASLIKTVAVYEGSVIVEFLVEAEEEDEYPDRTLRDVERKFAQAVDEGLTSLGAPILEAVSNG